MTKKEVIKKIDSQHKNGVILTTRDLGIIYLTALNYDDLFKKIANHECKICGIENDENFLNVFFKKYIDKFKSLLEDIYYENLIKEILEDFFKNNFNNNFNIINLKNYDLNETIEELTIKWFDKLGE